MIIGIGTDIVEIDRIKKAVLRWGRRFLQRVYTEDEISYCYSKRDPFSGLAGRFAAKEATTKAFSSFFESEKTVSTFRNMTDKLSLKDIEIINNKSGKPNIIIKNPAFTSERIKIHSTISHEKIYAIATVLIEIMNNE